jgi:hypothetical protein
MSNYEYRVVAAPRKGKSGKGVKGGPAKFANAISGLMNNMAAEGWDYLRADTLPCEERQGLTSKTVKYHSMLVFRRAVANEAALDEEPLALEHHEPEPEQEPEPQEDVPSEADTDDAAPEVEFKSKTLGGVTRDDD